MGQMGDLISIDSEPDGTCESRWGINNCPNKAEVILKNKGNFGFGIMCKEHLLNYLADYGMEGLFVIFPYSQDIANRLLDNIKEKVMNSKEKLALALEEVKRNWDDNLRYGLKLNDMIKKAREGYYSDYDSPIATPCIQLVIDLTEIEAYDIADRAKEGEFDATKEEADDWYNREGKHIMKQLGLGI